MVNPNPTYYKRVVLDGTRTAFFFSSVIESNRFIADVERNADARSNARAGFNSLNAPSYIRNNTSRSWYGTSDASIVSSNISTYLFNNELDSYLQNLRSQTINVDKLDIDQVKKIQFTEQEIGIFSFDLASLGLLPVFEYYSDLLKKVVNGNFVLVKKDQDGVPLRGSDGKMIFYHVFAPKIPKHYVSFDGGMNGYYSSVLGIVVEKENLKLDEDNNQFYYPERDEIPEHIVVQRQVIEDGKKKWMTTWKKSFIYIPKVSNPLPRIDIIVSNSFAGGANASTQMIYSSMAAIALAERLSAAGINYRMVVSNPVGTINGAVRYLYPFVIAKADGEVLDKNNMSILMSDGRMIRFQGFKGDFAFQYDAGFDNGISVSSIGRPINDALSVDKQFTQEEADDINSNGGTQVSAEGNGNMYIFRNLNNLRQQGTQEFSTQEEAYNYIRQNDSPIDRVKMAYMDYLAKSTDPSDLAASKNWDSKILFSGAMSERDAINQYQKAIRSISRIK